MSTVNDFLSAIKNNGISRPSRYEVLIGKPTGPRGNFYRFDRDVSLMCEISQLPSLIIQTKQLKIQGPAYQRPIGMDFNGDGIPMTFYVDKNLKIKTFFDDWMYSIVNPNSFNVKYQSEYVTTLRVSQLDESDNIKYTIELLDAFPRSMGQLDLNASSANQMHRLTVVFAYRKWQVIKPYNTQDNYSDTLQQPYQFQPQDN
jgi:hypothetical protein